MIPGSEFSATPLDDTLVDVTYTFGGGTVNFEFVAFGENVYQPEEGGERKQEQ